MIAKINQVIVTKFGKSVVPLAISTEWVREGMPVKATSWPSEFGRVCRLRLRPGRVGSGSGGYAG